MRLCVRNHARLATLATTNGAARLLAVALVALTGVAPISSSWHELTVRHVVCAEHGELTDVPTSQGLSAAPIRSFGSIEGRPTEAVEGHEHCTSSFIVRGRAHLAVVRSFVRFTPPPSVVRDLGAPLTSPGRAFVLASAPKTSPPKTV
jgi:hypothetical protein